MNTKPNNQKKVVIAVVALLVAVSALFGVYRFTKAPTAAGAKNITVEVFHRDGSLKSFDYDTEREYLGQVLADEGLAAGDEGPYGLFITTVDGETADADAEEWWCITKDGTPLNTSADQTPIADGDKYELTLTVGY